MRLKSYYSETVEAAIELARQDLGDEALLVNARPATPDQLHLGDYEVVFGVARDESSPAVTGHGPLSAEARDTTPTHTGLREPTVNRWTPPEYEAQPKTGNRPPEATAPSDPGAAMPSHPGQDLLQHNLSSSNHLEPNGGLGEQIADLRRVVEALAAYIPSEKGPDETARSLVPATAPLLKVDPTLGVPGAARGIIALVGPAGVGKTTALIQLAVNYGLAENRTVQLVTTDVHRVGAASRLKSLSSVLGLPCRPAGSAEALEQLLEDTRGLDLVLVDTPPNLSSSPGLAQYLARHPEIDTHLVLAASMSAGAMTAAATAFRETKPGKLILTRLEELSQESHLAEEILRVCSRTGLPLSFFATSSQVPDGLEAASEARLAGTGDARPTEMRATA